MREPRDIVFFMRWVGSTVAFLIDLNLQRGQVASEKRTSPFDLQSKLRFSRISSSCWLLRVSNFSAALLVSSRPWNSSLFPSNRLTRKKSCLTRTPVLPLPKSSRFRRWTSSVWPNASFKQPVQMTRQARGKEADLLAAQSGRRDHALNLLEIGGFCVHERQIRPKRENIPQDRSPTMLWKHRRSFLI